MPLIPRWYQQEAIDATIDYLKTTSGNGIIQVPTAGGKSLIQAEICRRALSIAPNHKILCLTHITKLLSQNYDELKEQYPESSAGIYSATYKKKDSKSSIIFAGIQSIYKKAHIFGPVSMILVDECQAVPTKDEGMYLQLFEELKKFNPYIRIVGLSASPWKLNGPLVGEGIFDDIFYKIEIKTLLDEGFLARLVTPKTSAHVDSSKIKVSNTGEFNEKALQDIMDDDYLTNAAIDDALNHGGDRNSWLVFCSGVSHAEHVCERLNSRSIQSAVISGSTPQDERERLIGLFKSHKLKCLVSVEVITTGFNAKNADLLIILRSTKSSGLWLQILGRGMRTHPDKNDCMVLDYGENIERFGPIEFIEAPPKKIKGSGSAPIKKCWQCENPVPASLTSCPHCGALFDMQTSPSHGTEASTASILAEYKQPEWKMVDSINARNYKSKKSNKHTLRINFQCGIMTYSDWRPVEGNKGITDRFKQFWMSSTGGNLPPSTIDEAVNRIGELKISELLIDENGKYPKIINCKTFM